MRSVANLQHGIVQKDNQCLNQFGQNLRAHDNTICVYHLCGFTVKIGWRALLK